MLQDKALRRISELKEQCQLEQKAKRHLEEELRSDLEEKHHVIEALQTKVSLLKSGGKGVLDENNEDNATGNLVDISDDNSATSVASDIIQRDGDKIANLEGKLTNAYFAMFNWMYFHRKNQKAGGIADQMQRIH